MEVVVADESLLSLNGYMMQGTVISKSLIIHDTKLL